MIFNSNNITVLPLDLNSLKVIRKNSLKNKKLVNYLNSVTCGSYCSNKNQTKFSLI